MPVETEQQAVILERQLVFDQFFRMFDLVSSGIDSLKTGSKKSSKAKTPENDDIEKFKKSKKKKKKDKNKKKKKD